MLWYTNHFIWSAIILIAKRHSGVSLSQSFDPILTWSWPYLLPHYGVMNQTNKLMWLTSRHLFCYDTTAFVADKELDRIFAKDRLYVLTAVVPPIQVVFFNESKTSYWHNSFVHSQIQLFYFGTNGLLDKDRCHMQMLAFRRLLGVISIIFSPLIFVTV